MNGSINLNSKVLVFTRAIFTLIGKKYIKLQVEVLLSAESPVKTPTAAIIWGQ